MTDLVYNHAADTYDGESNGQRIRIPAATFHAEVERLTDAATSRPDVGDEFNKAWAKVIQVSYWQKKEG